jgi:hypothetical protein
VTRRLTLPSRGCPKGCAFCAPLMSNVRRHNTCRAVQNFKGLQITWRLGSLAGTTMSMATGHSARCIYTPSTHHCKASLLQFCRGRRQLWANPSTQSRSTPRSCSFICSRSRDYRQAGLLLPASLLNSSRRLQDPASSLPTQLASLTYAPPQLRMTLAARTELQPVLGVGRTIHLLRVSGEYKVTPNPSIEGMPKRLRLSVTPHVKR